ncbi:MAG: hypothetical protein HN712_06225 [Gemmatimonadetes bacterium]|jgi:hypothetical protein|nr:hypothetical protein [Gemmatimonadota bacterium]MBT6143917.1 hypothetical protein [Gemmatimonadota bacterium]MBT7859889.1 hypothetical protein [Gemmatimonadota bacterium]
MPTPATPTGSGSAADAYAVTTTAEANLGILDGAVSHDEVNRSISGANRAILFGQQTRLPHFPDDRRLPRIHAGDERVLFFWRVLKKVPANLRRALIEAPVSITLVRGDTLLCFQDVRHHQAVHLGRRRRTIYLPELLMQQAEEKGYDYWAIAEGLIYAGWMLLDYLLLVDVLTDFGHRAMRRTDSPEAGEDGTRLDWSGLRLSEPLLRRLVQDHNRHRREHPDPGKSEVEEFIAGYRSALIRVKGLNVWSREPWEIGRDLFDETLEQRWAQMKMERIADIFDYPRMFLFDRDIIHGAARDLALRRGQSLEPASFADALHDYRDAGRFDRHPLMTEFCRGIVPKPKAQFLQKVVELGAAGLRDFFDAYSDGEPEALDLIHPLWMYLVSLSSDPAGVFAHVGQLRSRVRRVDGVVDENAPGPLTEREILRHLTGICVRLDRLPGYRRLAMEVVDLGEGAHDELLALIENHGLDEADEWATFKMKKQAIVACACELLEKIDGHDSQQGGVVELAARRRIHEDEDLQRLLTDRPHRFTSDPSGVLMYCREYRRTLAQFGSADPDTNSLLASILIRLDQSDRYEELIDLIPSLGPPAVSALYGVLDQISERDERRAPILQRSRRILGSILMERQFRAKARQRARSAQAYSEMDRQASAPPPPAAITVDDVTIPFVALHRELLTGVEFSHRGDSPNDEPGGAGHSDTEDDVEGDVPGDVAEETNGEVAP